MPNEPLAYFITFSCYGHRVHGDAEGSVNRHHRGYQLPPLAPNPNLEQHERANMSQVPYRLDEQRARIALDAVRDVCRRRRWHLCAWHARETHVHAVVEANTKPERVMVAFKAYTSRYLNKSGLDEADRRRWTEHGSTRYLWSRDDVVAAIEYVLYEQGEPMLVFTQAPTR
ncbi:transposase [bacterium]|nr:transposase [bacterium]